MLEDGIFVRADKVPAAQRPKTWSDLTDAKYKGQMVMPDPSFTALQLIAVGTLSQKLGWEFYEKLRKKKPKAKGDVDLKWHIDAGGLTSKVKVVRATLKGDAFHQCLKDQVKSWTFPQGIGPADKEISYTFGPPL